MITARRVCLIAAWALLLCHQYSWASSTCKAGWFNIGTVANNPFTADIVAGAYHVSPDASMRETGLIPTVHIARDSEGRVAVKIPMWWAPGRSRREDADFYWTNICDPVAKTMIHIKPEGTTDSKPEAAASGSDLVLHISGKAEILSNESLSAASEPSVFRTLHEPEAKKQEDIGEQSLLGVQAHGYRWWLPVNGVVLESDYTEVFQSEELASDISRLSTRGDGPRGRDEMRAELKNLQRVEPDPGLFQIPQGYKIEDLTAKPSGKTRF